MAGRIRLAIGAGIFLLMLFAVLFTRTATNFATIGDTAIIESYTWMAARANLLFGPYSRFQWHHPGPLYFFWLVPFYVASGTRPAGLSLGAVTLNMSMVAIASAILIRRAGAVLATAMLATLTIFMWRAAPMLTSVWNPNVPVLAMVALIIATADSLTGRIKTLPVVVAVATLVAQTHVAFVPSAVALGLIALMGGIATARRNREPALTRSLVTSGVVLIVLWLPTLIEQIRDRPGNLTQLWTFFVVEAHRGQRLSIAFQAWCEMLVGMFRPEFATAHGQVIKPGSAPAVQALALLQVIGVLIGTAAAFRARRWFEWALGALLLMVSLLALWSTTQIQEAIIDHDVFWISAIGVLNTGLVISFVARLLRQRTRLPFALDAPANAVVCWLLFVLCAVPAARWMRAAVVYSSSPIAESETVSGVADELGQYLNREHIARPLILIDQDAWPLAAGVITQLQKHGIAVAVEDDWLPMFTPKFAATGQEPVVLAIYAKPQHVRMIGKPGDSVLFEHDPRVFVHRTVKVESR